MTGGGPGMDGLGFPSEGRHSVVRPWLRLATAGFLFVPLGVLITTLAYDGSRRGAGWATTLFWLGMVTLFAPAARVLWSETLSRGQTVTLLLAVGMGLYVVRALHDPGMLAGYDELLHYRTLDDIAQTGRLFSHNPLLPISPYYPGLEIVTNAVASLTGMSAVTSGIVVIAAARLLLVVALFLFLERVASPTRLAGLGTLLYMTAPSFLAFDASFAYESLALPLSVFCVFVVRRAQAEEGRMRHLLNGIAALAVLAVVVTHHVTSFILAGVLVVWTAITLLSRRRPRDPLPGGGWLAPLAVAAIAVWLSEVATATVGYLAPHASGALKEALRIIAGEGVGRRLFESAGGVVTPPLERAVGLGSVALIVGLLPFGVVYVWRRQRRELLARFLMVCALVYPAVMALRFTKSGWEMGSRALAFLSIPVAFVVAAGIQQLRTPLGRRFLGRAAVVAGLVVIFLGGIIAGTSPTSRLPRPYTAGAYSASIEGQGVATAMWARTVLGGGHRMIADSTNSSLMGSFGRQQVLSSSDKISVSGLYLLPFGDYQREMIGRARIEYAVVDRRIAGVRPPAGFFFEKWERQVADVGTTIDPWVLSRFDELAGADRVFDSGDIQIYDIRGLRR